MSPDDMVPAYLYEQLVSDHLVDPATVYAEIDVELQQIREMIVDLATVRVVGAVPPEPATVTMPAAGKPTPFPRGGEVS